MPGICRNGDGIAADVAVRCFEPERATQTQSHLDGMMGVQIGLPPIAHFGRRGIDHPQGAAPSHMTIRACARSSM